MMGIEKLIHCLQCCARVDAHNVGCDDCGLEYCGPECQQLCWTAATALSTLQTENERLRKELEYEREHANAYYEECGQWEAENEKLLSDLRRLQTERDALLAANQHLMAEREQLTAERDAAVERLREWEKFDIYLLAHNFLIPEKWRGIQKED